MKKCLILFIGILLFQCQTLFAQGNSLKEFQGSYSSTVIQDDRLRDSLITWQERVLIQTDKKIISKGTPLFFKAYTLTGPKRVRATLSKVLKVELLNKDKEILLTQHYQIIEGVAEGALILPKKMKNGVYTLRAYTRWMQNYGEAFYGTKTLKLVSEEKKGNRSTNETDEITVSFHPEGGNLVANVPNRLLIKARSSSFEKVHRSGQIYDEDDNVVASVVSFNPLVMSTILTPKPKGKYFLKLNNGQSFELPKILSEGYVLQINNLDVSNLSVRIQSTRENIKRKVWLKGRMGGITYFNKELESAESFIEINVPKKGIPFGVLTVSLNDEDGMELAKRPVNIGIKNSLKLGLVQEEVETNADELVFKITVKDANGGPIATKVCLSAVNFNNNSDSRIAPSWYEIDWDNYGLRQNSTDYERKERFATDLELLTRINKDNDFVSQTVPNNIKYSFQKGLDLFGYAYNLDNELLANTTIQMLGASDLDLVFREFETDSFGRVRLENLQFDGETELVFRTKGENSASRLVKIVPVQESLESKNESNSKLDFRAQEKRNIVSSSPWQPYSEEDIIELDEVEVAETKVLKNRGAAPSVYGVYPTKVTYQDVERPKSIPQLFLGIPGVQINGLGTLSPQLSLPKAAGTGPVLWVLDGMPLFQPTNLNDIMSLITAGDVERIEILFAAQAAIYGTRASGGAIVVYTRSGAGMDNLNRKEGHLNFQGYYEAPSFNDYIKEIYKKPKKYLDATTTLFWDPNIITDENGEATIRFRKPFDCQRLILKATTMDSAGKVGLTQLIYSD